MSDAMKEYIQKSIVELDKPENDHHLAFAMDRELVFFNNNENSDLWEERLSFFQDIDYHGNFLIEAVYQFGLWKKGRVFADIQKAMELFKASEYQAIENKWHWILTTSTEQQKTLYYQFNKAKLVELGTRISSYLTERISDFPTRAIMDMTNQALDMLDYIDPEQITKIFDSSMKLGRNEHLNYSFRYGFYDACIAIKKHEKDEATVEKIHREILSLKIHEAESKGTTSKMILSVLLEQALEYCMDHVGDSKMVETLKKRIASIDYTDELAVIEVPEDIKEELNKAYIQYDEHVKTSVKRYVEEMAGKNPFQILYGVLNDESIFRMDVENTKDFTSKLLKESISNIFTTTVDLSFKRVKLESEEEKYQARLHQNLQIHLHDTLDLIYYIASEIEDQCIVSIEDIYHFLLNCDIINENDHPMIVWGIMRHINRDYLSSVSILMPKIESALFLYLQNIGADITSYTAGSLSQRTLGGLLEQKEIIDNFSIDYQYFMKLLLIADDSINLRNRLSHGSTLLTEYNRKTSLVTIFLLLKLYAKSFKIPGE
jgi:hypothetical protein